MCVMGAVPVPAVAVVVVEVAAVEELVTIFRMKSYHPLPPCNTFGLGSLLLGDVQMALQESIESAFNQVSYFRDLTRSASYREYLIYK